MSEEKWSGVERRNVNFCGSHLDIVKSVAIIETTIIGLDKRINGSLKSIEDHMHQGAQWRIAIIGVAVTLLLQMIGGIIVISKLAKQVEINTIRLNTAESVLPSFYAKSAQGDANSKRIDSLEVVFQKVVDRMNLLERKYMK